VAVTADMVVAASASATVAATAAAIAAVTSAIDPHTATTAIAAGTDTLRIIDRITVAENTMVTVTIIMAVTATAVTAMVIVANVVRTDVFGKIQDGPRGSSFFFGCLNASRQVSVDTIGISANSGYHFVEKNDGLN
jgi:hypothetical protein